MLLIRFQRLEGRTPEQPQQALHLPLTEVVAGADNELFQITVGADSSRPPPIDRP